MRFGLFRVRSPLLTESRLFSLPVGTEMFHFPTFPPLALYIQARVTGHDPSRVSPFGHPRIKALLAAPRGLSQPYTSFFGSWSLGIHHALLLTYSQRLHFLLDARVHYAVLKVRARFDMTWTCCLCSSFAGYRSLHDQREYLLLSERHSRK